MIRHHLPKRLREELFGHRSKYGQEAWTDDPDWQKWLAVYPEAYRLTQRSNSLQKRVNEAGYDILSKADMEAKDLGEIGPGGAYHVSRFRGTPASYHAFDVCTDFFADLKGKLPSEGIALHCHHVKPYEARLPIPDQSLDLVLSFYSMEHLHPLSAWLDEIFRVLRPGGKLVGAVPTEGGLAWALGRWFTSRPALKREHNLDIRKIVCWEHPNTCDEIADQFRARGNVHYEMWPLALGGPDFNLIMRFVIEKP